MTHPFCSCLDWLDLGAHAKAELDRYTRWLRDHNRIPRERYASEGTFKPGIIRWLCGQKDFAFINAESGYVDADSGASKRPKCDLHFGLGDHEHWMELKTGPGAGNAKYKTSESEWRTRWSRDYQKLLNPNVPQGSKRHLVSFGLGLVADDGTVPNFFDQVHRCPKGTIDGEFEVRFASLGSIDWKLRTPQELNHLFLSVVCI